MKSILLITLVAGSALSQAPAPLTPAEEAPKIIAEASGRLSAALGEAIAKGGLASALSVCSERAPQIAAEVGKTHGVTLRRATAKPRNPKNAADDEEKAALEGFAEALSKQEAPRPRIITNADGSTSFLSPILLANPLCLQCHGTPSHDITNDTLAAIRKLYPDDKATGFKPGDLRGLWRVTFPAKSVKPGINEKFLDPNLKVEEWTEKFETESREIFHQRGQIAAAVGLKPGMTVADIGAGTGLFTLPFAQAVGERGKVYAVEIAKSFLDHIKARAAKASATNVQTILCTERSVELPEASIDLAFICDVYHHFEYPQASLATLHKALKPGGELVLIDFKRIPGESSDFVMGHVRAGQEVFEAEITAAGFEKVGEVKDILKENYFVKFRRK